MNQLNKNHNRLEDFLSALYIRDVIYRTLFLPTASQDRKISATTMTPGIETATGRAWTQRIAVCTRDKWQVGHNTKLHWLVIFWRKNQVTKLPVSNLISALNPQRLPIIAQKSSLQFLRSKEEGLQATRQWGRYRPFHWSSTKVVRR